MFYIGIIRRAINRIDHHLQCIQDDIDRYDEILPWRFYEVGREVQFIDESIQEAFLTNKITTNSYILLTKWHGRFVNKIEAIINNM